MKTKMLQCVSLMILAMVMNVIEAEGQELSVSDTQNSGCVSHKRVYGGYERPTPTIILEKEGDILSVQVLNYESNCGTYDFDVKSNFIEGSEGALGSLHIKVIPVTGGMDTDCICDFNVSFTVHGLEPDTFYLSCWWYEGLVELTDGEPLVLADVYEDVTFDGMNYTLRKAFHHAMVTRNNWAGEVCIPSEVNYEGQTYTVTSIDGNAFGNNTALTKVTFPRTITNMDFDAGNGFNSNPFFGCTALKSIEVEEGNPALCAVGGVLFNKEKTRLHTYPAAADSTSYTIPEGVNWIDGLAFSNNRHLVTVYMPDDVTNLGYSAFYGCTNLEEVRLSTNLKILAQSVFCNCEHLKTITIPQGVTYLGTKLFSGCTSLTTVEMPESVTSTDNAIFENCISLESVTLSPNMDMIKNQMFLNCKSLTEIQIPEGVAWVLFDVFKNCSALKTLDFPESVQRIGSSSFSGCKLNSLLIRGIIDSYWVTEDLFAGMGTQTNVYVQSSEVEKYQKAYKGKVYALTDEMNGITDLISPIDNPSELYDLQGRKLRSEPANGVYIKDGKKYVVK